MEPYVAEDIRIGPYQGRVSVPWMGSDVGEWLKTIGERVTAPGVRVLSRGRNRNVLLRMPFGPSGETRDVVVKSFGTPPWWLRPHVRQVGSKARRTWMAAVHLRRSGVGTPEPVAFLDRWDGTRLLESHVLTVYQDGISSFAHELDRIYRREPDCGFLMALLKAVAEAVRDMHDSGFIHRDLGNQNILLRRAGPGAWDQIAFIDLNRGRIKTGVTDRERGRDLSRIALPSDFMRVFREMYCKGLVPSQDFLKWEAHYRRRFLCHTATRRWRHPLRERRRRPAPGDPPVYPDPKDIWIWDARSDQPIVTLTPRDRARRYPLRRNAWLLAATLRAVPGLLPEYRRCLRDAFSRRVRMDNRIGVAVEPVGGEGEDRKRRLLNALGPVPVLVRFCHHRGEAEVPRTATFAEALARDGHPLSVALVQDRMAVRDPESWKRFVDAVMERMAPLAELVEAGHAINRVKWGIWDFDEYRRLMEPVAAWRSRCPELAIGGPAAIDFEYPYVPAALGALPPGSRFDVLTHHLYVDRRGAPESRQGRFSSLEKFALARALANRYSGGRLVLTEFNWPLAGTGVYSPVGAPYVSPGPRVNDPSVTEQEAAAYLLRYVLIAVASGLVERVFWWRLVAHGYGLVDDRGGAVGWRERPAYQALRVLLARLRGGSFVEYREVPVEGPGAETGMIYRFESAAGIPWWLAYTLGTHCRMPMPEGTSRAEDAFGSPIEPRGGHVELGMFPVMLA